MSSARTLRLWPIRHERKGNKKVAMTRARFAKMVRMPLDLFLAGIVLLFALPLWWLPWDAALALGRAYGYAFDYVGYTLDAPGTITVSTTGPVSTSIAGSGYLQLTTNLDGNYVGPLGTWNLAAGSHWIQLYVQGRGLAGYYSGNFYGSAGTGSINDPFDIRVQSVPEPTTLAVLGIGVAAGLRRRKQSR